MYDDCDDNSEDDNIIYEIDYPRDGGAHISSVTGTKNYHAFMKLKQLQREHPDVRMNVEWKCRSEQNAIFCKGHREQLKYWCNYFGVCEGCGKKIRGK